MCNISMYWKQLIDEHFNNFYGMESDPKKHEQYYRNVYYDMSRTDLLNTYKSLIRKAGSFNSSAIGELNAVVWLLKHKYNWRINNK